MAQNQEDKKVRLSRITGTDFAKISIQNPPMNFLSGEVVFSMQSCLEKARDDARTKALFVEGSGLFSAGADVNDIWAIAQSGNRQQALGLLAKANEVVNLVENLGKPTIALIDRFCLGGGNELATACSARIATERAQFGQPEINLGIMPGMGGTQRLPRLVPLRKAIAMILTGDFISAKDALEMGLVDKVVSSSEDLISEGQLMAKLIIDGFFVSRRNCKGIFGPIELTESPLFTLDFGDVEDAIKSKSPEAVKAILDAMRRGLLLSLSEALKIEQELFVDLVFTEQARRGMAKLLKVDLKTRGGEFLLPSERLPDIFTVSDLTEDQKMIRDSVSEFVESEITTDQAVRRIESKDWGFTRELLRKSGELGLLGAEIPEEYGGQGLDKVTGTIIAEGVARQGSFACTFLAHTGIGTLPIRFFGTEDQKNKYLPKLVSGEWIAAYCLTEGVAGSDANNVKTSAVISEDGKYYILNGEKIFVTNGGFADLYIVFAKIDANDLTAFIVERTFEGVDVGKKEEHKMGIHGSSTATVVLNSVKVPVGNLLGEQGKGFKIAVNILNLGRFKLAAACLGSGQLCFDEALKRARERKQFGKPIISLGAIRHKLALMAANNYAMQSVVYRTAGYLEEAIQNVDSNDAKAVLKAVVEFAVECSLVKVFCSEALDFIVDENVQIHGGYGFCEGGPERHYRDSRVNRIFEGTNEINRLLSIGQILKKAMTGSLPLMTVAKKLLEGDLSSCLIPIADDDVGHLHRCLNDFKRAVVLLVGAAWNKFSFQLQEHQVILMSLADCLINIYVMESVLAALNKNKNERDMRLVQLIFDEKSFEIEKMIRRLVVMCTDENTRGTVSEEINHLLEFVSVDVERLTNEIVSGF